MQDDNKLIRLEKEVRILKKKLARSEANRITLEEMWDRNSRLFETFNNEINTQREIVQEKKEQLEALASKLAKYLSPQVYDSIFTGEREVRIETYRKHLTIFFSDIVGFTSKSEIMETRKLSRWLNTYLDRMAEIALLYEGTLDKFIGDAVMVFFGDPKTNGEEKDAFDCISMAMAMRQEAKKLGVDIRIGVHSGECTVGNFGSENRMEYTVIGAPVNLASRLESNSKPGQILISDSTYRLIKDKVRCEERGPIRVKGIERDIQTYWVVDDLLDENLTWDDSFSINIDEVDQQHKELVRRVGLLMKTVSRGEVDNRLRETFDFLQEYTKDHFEDEEKLMLQHAYPEYQLHKEEHIMFVNELAELQRRNERNTIDSSYLLILIRSKIVNWLLDHIKVSDAKIARYIMEKRD